MSSAIGIVEKGVAHFDRQLACSIHCIAGDDRKVQQRVLDLDRVGETVAEAAGDHGLHFDFLTERAAQHVIHCGDEAADIDHLRLQRLAAAEGEKLAGEPRSALDGG